MKKLLIGIIPFPLVGIFRVFENIIDKRNDVQLISITQNIRNRALNKEKDNLKLFKDYLDKGLMIPTEKLTLIINQELENCNDCNIILIKDYPKTVEQLENLNNHLLDDWEFKLFLIRLTDVELKRRIKIKLTLAEDNEDGVQRIQNRLMKQKNNLEKLSPYAENIIDISNSATSTLEKVIDDIIKTNS